jgi:hypothetical protein
MSPVHWCITAFSFIRFFWFVKLRETLSGCSRWGSAWFSSEPFLKNRMSFNFRMSAFFFSSAGNWDIHRACRLKCVRYLLVLSLWYGFRRTSFWWVLGGRLLLELSVVSVLDLCFWKLWKLLIKIIQALHLEGFGPLFSRNVCAMCVMVLWIVLSVRVSWVFGEKHPWQWAMAKAPSNLILWPELKESRETSCLSPTSLHH